jgi:hypothetical protein
MMYKLNGHYVPKPAHWYVPEQDVIELGEKTAWYYKVEAMWEDHSAYMQHSLDVQGDD